MFSFTQTRGQDNNVKHLKAKQGYRKIKKAAFPDPARQYLAQHPHVRSLPPKSPPSSNQRPEMSFAAVTVMALMCSSAVIAFVLQPSEQEDAPPRNSHRCPGLSPQSIRKELLAALNLQMEPRLPEGAREQWSATAKRLKALAVSSGSSSSDDGLDASGCCAETTEVSMTDLGWDNWMIFPERVTLVHCAPCGQTASCKPEATAPQRDDLQVQAPCCRPTSQEAVPVMYRDEWNTMVITSMHLTGRCGCPASLQPPQE